MCGTACASLVELAPNVKIAAYDAVGIAGLKLHAATWVIALISVDTFGGVMPKSLDVCCLLLFKGS